MGSALKSSLPARILASARTILRIHPILWFPRSHLIGEIRRLTTIQLYKRTIATLYSRVNSNFGGMTKLTRVTGVCSFVRSVPYSFARKEVDSE